MTPASIKYGLRIWAFLIFVGFASALTSLRDGEAWEILLLLAGPVVNAVLVAFCAMRRKWARFWLAISVGAGLVLIFVRLPGLFGQSFEMAIVAIGANALAVLATWLLFTEDSTDWFEGEIDEVSEDGEPITDADRQAQRTQRRRLIRIGGIGVAAVVLVGGAYWQFGAALTDWDPIRERCLGPTELGSAARQDRVEACTRMIDSGWFSDVERAEFLLARGHAQDTRADRSADYARATQADPRNARAWRALGEVNLSLGSDDRIDQAVDAFNQVLALTPDDAEARGLLGLALVQDEQIEAAIPELRAGLQAQPGNTDLVFPLLNAQRWAGRYEDALDDVGAFLVVQGVGDEDIVVARIYRATILLELGRTDDAQQAADALYEEQVPDFLVSLLVVLSRCTAEDTDAAWQSVERVIDDGWLLANDWRNLLVEWGIVTAGAVAQSEGGTMTRPIARAIVGWIEDGCAQPFVTMP